MCATLALVSYFVCCHRNIRRTVQNLMEKEINLFLSLSRSRWLCLLHPDKMKNSMRNLNDNNQTREFRTKHAMGKE